MKKLTKFKLLKALTGERDLSKRFEEWGFDNIEDLESVAYNDFFHLMYIDKDVRKHCLKTANKISPRFPLLRLVALYHDCAYVLEEGRPSCKEARNYAKESTDQMLMHFEFSESDRKYAAALIHVHNYNLLSTNVKNANHLKQPLRQWRKALMDARKISSTVEWRDVLRLVVADCDGKNAWWRKWLVRPIVRYFKQQDAEGNIVYSRNDLAVSALDILFACPELDKRYFKEIFDHLLNYVAFHGYDVNNKTELVMEAVAYIRGKQEKTDVLDSRVGFV